MPKPKKSADEVDALLKATIDEIDSLYTLLLTRRRELHRLRMATPLMNAIDSLMSSILSKKIEFFRIRREFRERDPNITPFHRESQAEMLAAKEGAAAFEAQLDEALRNRRRPR